MNCSNCGTKIPEGSLYCAECGKDVSMVPDFEAELELNMSESIHTIAADVAHEQTKRDSIAASTSRGKFVRKHIMRVRFVSLTGIVCLVGFMAVGLFAGIKIWQYYSYDHQLRNAVAYAEQSNYEWAEYYYRRALEIDDSDIDVFFALADACLQKGNKIEYEYLLTNIIKNPGCSEEQLRQAYGKLIAIYRDRDEYETIHEMLSASENEKIKNAYQAYLASPPEFNFEEGYYTKAIPLKLTSATTGKIYYTMDGTEPDSESLLYTAPILLEKSAEIKAIVINEYGVSSSVVSMEYQVHLSMEEEPEISVISGEYDIPMLIEVEQKDGKEVYYTTDGTKPTLHSSLYLAPIPMPLGKSFYCFAYVEEDGTCGKVAQRTYELHLDAEVTVPDAEALVVEYMLILGTIFNEDGTFSENSTARYLYQYQYVITIEGAGDYYVVAEVYQDESGVQNKTGSFYAVSTQKKECFKLLMDENNNYSLVDILIDSPFAG